MLGARRQIPFGMIFRPLRSSQIAYATEVFITGSSVSSGRQLIEPFSYNTLQSLASAAASNKLDFVVHLTRENVLRTKEYEQWAESLGTQCTLVFVHPYAYVPKVQKDRF